MVGSRASASSCGPSLFCCLGWDGLGDGDAHAIATLARKQQPIERRYDPWGHWGGYYGPMIGNP